MEIGILVKVDRDESGHFEAPEVTAYPTLAEARDAMLADFTKTTDDTDVSWWAFEREVRWRRST